MGDSITEGTLVEWTKNIGDQVEVDDVVAVIETDKVSIDIRTDFAGVITEQLAAIDDTLEVNAPLFKLGFMSAFVKASVSALQFMPAVNAYIDGKDIVYNNYQDISVAVASPTGLVV